jgi:uncharacterized protein (DUF1684 family)
MLLKPNQGECMKSRQGLFFILLSLLIIQCSKPKQAVDPAYAKTVEDWHTQRVTRLKTSENSWLNLIGLFWLKEGENKFGSDSSNVIVFPAKAPKFCGSFTLNNGAVTLHVAKGVAITADGKPVTEMKMHNDTDSNTSKLRCGSLLWYAIKRGSDYAIRLRDLENPLLKSFQGIERYPIDQAWRIEATLEPYTPPKTIFVPTILGTIDTMTSPGALRFEIDGTAYRIDPVLEDNSDKEFFIIFGDKTNGAETYGGGRFIYIPRPDSTGRTFLDFNRAYNPPCVFTTFATCPLPPAQNKLPIKILAGEKKWGESRH